MITEKRRDGQWAGLCLACLILSGCAVFQRPHVGATDTAADRRAAADRYLAALPTRVQIENLATLFADSATVGQREAVRHRILDGIRGEVLDKVTRDALVRNFTAAEIDALARFYATPAGQTIACKLPRYGAELMAPVQEELSRALSPTNNTPRAALQWSARLLERDVAPDEGRVRFSFTFTNTAARPVSILSVTAPEILLEPMSKTTYAPLESGSIEGILEIGDRKGEQVQMIGIKTTDSIEPSLELAFVAVVPDPLRAIPAFLRWELDAKPEARTTTVFRVATNHTVEILGIECDSPAFQATWNGIADAATNILVVTPRSTAAATNGEIRIRFRIGGRYERVARVFASVAGKPSLHTAAPSLWGGEVLWVDARTRREYEKGHLPGAFRLNHVEWDSQIQPVLNAWRPGMPVVVYCAKGCRAAGVVERLGEYGIPLIFYMVRAD